MSWEFTPNRDSVALTVVPDNFKKSMAVTINPRLKIEDDFSGIKNIEAQLMENGCFLNMNLKEKF